MYEETFTPDHSWNTSNCYVSALSSYSIKGVPDFNTSIWTPLDHNTYCLEYKKSSTYNSNYSTSTGKLIMRSISYGFNDNSIHKLATDNGRLFSLMNDSRLSFDYSSINFGVFLLFSQYNGTPVFWTVIKPKNGYMGSQSGCLFSGIETNPNQMCCALNSSSVYATNETIKRFNMSIGELQPYCTNFNLNVLNNLRVVSYGVIVGSGVAYNNATIDNISIEKYNGTNLLPYGSIGLNETGLCFNENRTSIDVPLIVNISDYEGDDIVYFTPSVYKTNVDYTSKYNYKTCFYGVCTNFLSTYTQPLVDNSSTCPLKFSIFDSGSGLYFNIMNVYSGLQSSFSGYVLDYVGSKCTDTLSKDWVFRVPFPLSNYSFKTHLYEFNYEDSDSYTVAFLDKNKNIVVNYTLNINESTIRVFQNGSFLGEKAYNVSYDYINDGLSFSILNNLVCIESTCFEANSYTHTYVSYILQGFGDTSNFRQEYFRIVGAYEMITAGIGTTTPPSSITFEQYDTSGYIYVTDDVHLTNFSGNSDIVKFVLDSNLTDCSYNITAVGHDTNISHAISIFDPLSFMRLFLGVEMESYIRSVGGYDLGINILWWFIPIGFIIVFGYMWITRGQVSFIYPLLVISIGVGSVAYLMGYTVILVVCLIFISFGLGVPLAWSFLAGGKEQ